MTPYEEIAVTFASALVKGDYERAHAFLAPAMQQEFDPDALREALYAMFRGYSDSEPADIHFDEQFSMSDWPSKQPEDLGWVYVSIIGEDFVEAVTVIVTRIGDALRIREIEWGRP